MKLENNERDLCDHFEGDCINNYDCINCLLMQEVNKNIRLESDHLDYPNKFKKKKRRF